MRLVTGWCGVLAFALALWSCSGSVHQFGPMSSGGAGGSDAGGASAGTRTEGGSAAVGGAALGDAGAMSDAGAAGEAPTVPGGLRCTNEGELTCAGNAQKVVSICQDGQRITKETCSATQNCDTTAGSCQDIVPGCESRAPGDAFCVSDTVDTCGPDLTTITAQPCVGKCSAGRCVPATCGDGKVQAGEECDDANEIDTDSCASCAKARCGDGFVQAGVEGCDDGNSVASDACPTNCQPAKCGDGFVQAGVEECDDNNAVNTDACVNCKLAKCGDGYIQSGVETCDDANAVATDACPTNCKVASCGDGFVLQGTEKCDDGNAVDSDGCRNNCTLPVCGDGAVGGTEECDDGNAINGDGCHAGCLGERTIWSGLRSTCVLYAGRVKCWGENGVGTLGYGGSNDPNGNNLGDQPNELGPKLAYVNLGTGVRVRALSTSNQNCAILTSGSVKCWGWNFYGQLGYDDVNDRGQLATDMGDALPTVNLGTGRTALSITGNGVDTCALLDDHTVKCWGYNADGELGYDDTANRGGAAGDMAKLGIVNLGMAAKAVVAGGTHTCAILNDGSLKCWGGNKHGQLGYGDVANRGDGPGEMAALGTVSLGTGRTVKQVTLGFDFSCALLDNNAVKCWGAGSFGNLGYGNQNDIGDGPNEMGQNLPAVSLGTGRFAVSIAAGPIGEFVCAILDNASLKCWGYNFRGRTGNGNMIDGIGSTTGQMGDNLPPVALGTGRTVTSVAPGFQSACAVLDDFRSVKCWGDGSEGELGYGNTNVIGDSPNQMGDSLPLVPLD